MRLLQRFAIFLTLVFSLAAFSQNTHIVIPAGTPEDKDLSAIAAEGDASKRAAAYEEFIQKYSDNKPAVAYAEWQLSQEYLATHDDTKALEWGDKALEIYPDNLDIIVSVTNIAVDLKDNGKIVDHAVKGAAACHSIPAQTKAADVSDTESSSHTAEQKNAAVPSCEFLENAAYNAIASEQDANKRMDYIEKFTPAFPKSRFDQQVSQLAMYSLQQLNQPQRLEAYGEKTLATNPDSIPTLLMLANAYAADPKQAGKSKTCASKVISLVGPNPGDDTKKSYAGLAHTALGRAALNEGKIPAAISDLKAAVPLLQQDPPDQQVALYYLGYAAAKQNRKAESIAALEKAAAINGPYQAPAKEMLTKVQAAGKK